jgi:hypothetical protein
MKRLDVAISGCSECGQVSVAQCPDAIDCGGGLPEAPYDTGWHIGGSDGGPDAVGLCGHSWLPSISSARKEGLDRDLRISATSEMETVDYSLLVVDAARIMNTGIPGIAVVSYDACFGFRGESRSDPR